MNITDMKPKDKARIVGYSQGQESYKRRLLAMGLTKGTELELVKVAPLGDPVELKIRGYSLSLRKDEAGIIELEALS